MELILLEKIANLGGLGDRVQVRPGFGRNYLIPHGKAVPATTANVAEFEQRRAEYAARADESLAKAQARATALGEPTVVVPANASTEGRLYGSVGPREIADALAKAGFDVEKSEVLLTQGPIRLVGDYELRLHLHADVEVPLKVSVVPES